MYIYVYICMCVFVCMCVCMCVCLSKYNTYTFVSLPTWPANLAHIEPLANSGDILTFHAKIKDCYSYPHISLSLSRSSSSLSLSLTFTLQTHPFPRVGSFMMNEFFPPGSQHVLSFTSQGRPNGHLKIYAVVCELWVCSYQTATWKCVRLCVSCEFVHVRESIFLLKFVSMIAATDTHVCR
jgi:hypothetical protein